MSWRAGGLKPWLWQRISAAYMAMFVAVAAVMLLINAPLQYAQWRAWFAHPAGNAATLLFGALLLVHAWVGLRNVLMDYVHRDGLRFALLAIIGLGLTAMGMWVFRVLWTVVA